MKPQELGLSSFVDLSRRAVQRSNANNANFDEEQPESA